MEIFKVKLIPSFKVMKSIRRFFFCPIVVANDCPSLFSNINKDLLCINLKLLCNIFLALPCPWAFNGSKLWILIKETFLFSTVWKFTIVGNQEGWFETYIEAFFAYGIVCWVHTHATIFSSLIPNIKRSILLSDCQPINLVGSSCIAITRALLTINK